MLPRSCGAGYPRCVIVIYPDTNALHADLVMQRKLSTDFLGLLEAGAVEVRLSPVVVAEANRQVEENVDGARKDITTAISKAKRNFALPDESTAELISALETELGTKRDQALAPLISHGACTIIDWSRVSAEELVERELERRKPVLEKSGQSIGLRDTVIWHGFLEVLDDLDRDEDFAIFVSGDGGFVTDGELHDDLESEIDGGWLEGPRIRVATSLASAMLEVEKLRSLIGEREAALSAALIAYIENFENTEWGSFSWGISPRPSIGHADFPFGFEDAELVSVSGVEVDVVGERNPAECIGYADFTFRGRMHPMDYQDSLYSEVSMVGGDVDGYVVYVEFEARAEILTEIEFELESMHASVVYASVSW